MPVAVIADIIGSRRLADRGASQRRLEGTIAQVEADRPLATRPLTAVVGDELQGVYPDLDRALAGLLLLRLALPEGLECRYGVGLGGFVTVPSEAGDLADGPAWWAAREAIETLHDKEQRSAPGARTWVAAADDEPDAQRRTAARATAYLLARDRLVSDMNERTRRIVYGRCLGRTQTAIAREEKITQPAVSQAVSGSGGAEVIEGFLQLAGDG